MKNRLFLITLMALIIPFSVSAQKTSSAKSNTLKVSFTAGVPEITWVTPTADGLKVDEKIMSLEVGIDSEGEIDRIELYVNNLPLGEERGFGKKSAVANKFDKFVEREVTLVDGINTIQVVAYNKDGGKAESTRTIEKSVDVTAGVLASRKDYAIVFGTDKYDEWSNLTNPVNDAETVGRELEESYGFEVEVVTNTNLRTMKEKIVSLYDKSYQENDQLMIFFAGHGQFDERTTRGFLVAKDSKEVDIIKDSYFSYSELRDLVDNIPCQHVMLVLDACFGGTFDQDIARSGSRGADNTDLASRTEFIERKLRYRTRAYLTSGGKEYVKDGRPGHHSPFAAQFLEALRSYGGADGILTKTELKGYMEVLAQQPMMGDFGTYEPGSDFIFIAK